MSNEALTLAGALIKSAQAAVDLACKYSADPFLIKVGDIGVEFRPSADNDPRINVSKDGFGHTCVNYTGEGLILDVYDNGPSAESVHTASIYNEDLVATPEPLIGASLSTIGHARDLIEHLATIWPDPQHSKEFREATCEWLTALTDRTMRVMRGGVEPQFIDTEGDIVVFREGARPVGISGYCPLSEQAVFLRWHGVLPEFRKKGYGVEMLERLYSQLRPKGCKAVYEVSDSESSKQFFLKHGFVLVLDPVTIRWVREQAGNFKYVLRHDL